MWDTNIKGMDIVRENKRNFGSDVVYMTSKKTFEQRYLIHVIDGREYFYKNPFYSAKSNQ